MRQLMRNLSDSVKSESKSFYKLLEENHLMPLLKNIGWHLHTQICIFFAPFHLQCPIFFICPHFCTGQEHIRNWMFICTVALERYLFNQLYVCKKNSPQTIEIFHLLFENKAVSRLDLGLFRVH